ncbi:MAG: class I SAM-dependent methyltransferase [Acetobacterium sp.]|nr:class I SAM-dependent methyltransferase [Acetobacterium sp.]
MLNTWDDYPEFKATTPFDILYFKQLIPKNFKILEIGCGYGRILSLLEKEGYFNLSGVDFSTVQLSRAKKNTIQNRVNQL